MEDTLRQRGSTEQEFVLMLHDRIVQLEQQLTETHARLPRDPPTTTFLCQNPDKGFNS